MNSTEIKVGQKYRIIDEDAFNSSYYEEGDVFIVDTVRNGEGYDQGQIYVTPFEIADGIVELVEDKPSENWRDTLEQRLTPRSLGCFEEVANVIGEDAAEIELQRVIDCDLVGEDWRECSTIATFIWSETPQGVGFWYSVKEGKYPETISNPQKNHLPNIGTAKHGQFLLEALV